MPLPHPADIAWVRSFRKRVAHDVPMLCDLAAQELDRDRFETLTADIVPLLTACRWIERHGRRVLRPRRVRGGSLWQVGQRHRVSREPLGRVGIIATWNYPVQLLGIQMMQALAAGNEVIVKPSERSPKVQDRLLSLARQAGMDESRLSWVSHERSAGEALIAQHSLDHVVFTGSTGVGQSIARTLAQSLTSSTLELSGCDSAIVLADADVGLAARSIAFAVLLNGGQTCMAPRRVLVEESIADAFIAELEKALARQGMLRSAHGREAEAAVDAVREAIGQGGELRIGDPDGGRWPLVVDNCPDDCRLARDEHFAPVLAVIRRGNADRLLECHRAIGQKLATSVFCGVRGRRAITPASLGSTVVTINDCVIPTGHPGVSIGGIGPSGWGVSRGELGLLAMTRPVFVSTTSSRFRTPLEPPSEQVRGKAEGFVRWWYG